MIIVSAVALLLLVTAGISALSKIDLFSASTNKSSETYLMKEKVTELSEWTTLKYEYSNVIISRTEKSVSLPGISKLNYAEAIKLISYCGYLKAGSDLSAIKISDDSTSDQLLVKVPKSKILDNVVETEKTTVEDVKGNIFSDYPTQVVFDEVNTAKKKLEKERIDAGFLEAADERVQSLLTSFFSANGFNNVVIEFY